MVKRLTKPFATALLSLCLLFAAAVAGFIASITVKAFADETAEPAVQQSFHKEKYDGLATAIDTASDGEVQVDNYLVVKGNSEEEYDIPDWTYGAGVEIPLPALAFGTEPDKLTFTLYDGRNRVICEDFYANEFSEYVNGTMPADHYVLEATIHDLTENDVVYKGTTLRYEFEVGAVDINFNMPADSETGYANYEWEYQAEHRDALFSQFSYLLSHQEEEVLSFTKVEPEGYWATLFDPDYTGYTITYNFARMHNDKYYKSTDYDLLSKIEPGTNATYTVYFNIEDKNHNPLTAMGDGRYDYFFTVTVYETLALPTINDDGLVYTGAKVMPVIAENALYNTVWSTDENAYIAGGEHSVSFELNDGVHYRWKGVNGETATVNFTIHKANNEWVRVPNVVDWQFESFDTQVNRISAVVKFLDEGKHVVFSITKEDGTALEGLTNFTVNDDGTIGENEVLTVALNGLKFGVYKLNVTVEATDNYNELKQSIEFRIYKATNAWASGENDIVLPSWIVGEYNETDNAITINAKYGQVNIRVEDIDGNVYYNSVEGLNKLNDLAVGKYLVKAWVDEADDFTALAERAFIIEVFEKAGLPWWATLCITAGALLIAALIIFILWKKGVFQILTGKIVLAIRTRASVDATIASVRAAKMMEEGKKSVAEAKRRERLEELRKKAQEARSMTPEERAAALEAKAQAEAEKAEKSRARSESMQKRADRLRAADNSEQADDDGKEQPEQETPEQGIPEQPAAEQEATAPEATEQEPAATEQPETEQETAADGNDETTAEE